MGFIEKTDFKKSKIKFDNGAKVLESSVKGTFTREKIIKQINVFAKQFNSPNVKIGIATHYKNVNKWGPAMMDYSNENIQVWNPIDSPDTADAYLKDTIDNVHIFIIEEKKIRIGILI